MNDWSQFTVGSWRVHPAKTPPADPIWRLDPRQELEHDV